jgi:hydrogenase expression/formation protein HypD
MVYSPLDAVALAQAAPHMQVVFLAVGFETTAPAHALAVLQALALGLNNFSLLVAHVLVPPAIEAIAAGTDSRIDGFLAAGHVCAVMGEAPYRPLAARLRVPVVITGFEPVDILRGVLRCVRQLESGRAEVENAYDRAVSDAGNVQAQDLVRRVFRVTTQRWRGMGELPHSGLALRDEYAAFDAERRFGLSEVSAADDARCRSGEVLRGVIKPAQCPAFGTLCTPDHPLGAPMVSSEGACAAYHRYRAPSPPASAP